MRYVSIGADRREPPERVSRAGHPNRNRASRAPRHWSTGIVRHTMARICRLRVEGSENVPEAGAFLLVFNHTSNFDPPLLRTAVPRDDLIGLVAASYRDKPWARFFIEGSGSLWLARGTADRTALRRATEALSRGTPVGMSPEGGRGSGRALRRAKPGVASIAGRSLAPVLPVGIVGADMLGAALRRGRRADVLVRIGKTFRPASHSDRAAKAQRQAQADEIMTRVANLLPPEYRGVYGPDRIDGLWS